MAEILNRHVPSLNGVLLSYSDIQSLEETARLMYDSPYSHIRIKAQFQVFAPQVGDVLGISPTLALMDLAAVKLTVNLQMESSTKSLPITLAY